MLTTFIFEIRLLKNLFLEENSSQGVSLKTEIVCKTLSELLKQFGLNLGANLFKKLQPS